MTAKKQPAKPEPERLTERPRHLREALQRVQRGSRVAEVRESLGMTGGEFAHRLSQTLHGLGIDGRRYDKAKLSRIESGFRHLTADELVAIALLDPERSFEDAVHWLALGRLRRAEQD